MARGKDETLQEFLTKAIANNERYNLIGYCLVNDKGVTNTFFVDESKGRKVNYINRCKFDTSKFIVTDCMLMDNRKKMLIYLREVK